MTLSEKIEAFFKDDRYWHRVHRIAHAQYQLAHSRDTGDLEFWRVVLEKLETEHA